ncbi:MAG TPA: WD40 repeat domain-containing protein [Bryobacteraceae bacterium]|nr:WD40 repeat domain-containing protein [Bryobacteraceae bacterium]
MPVERKGSGCAPFLGGVLVGLVLALFGVYWASMRGPQRSSVVQQRPLAQEAKPVAEASAPVAHVLEGHITGSLSSVASLPVWLKALLGNRPLQPDNYPPPDNYEIHDRCAGEGCSYQRRWRALNPIPLFAQWPPSSTDQPVYTLTERETVWARRGVWITRRPGVIEVLAPIVIDGFTLQPGDIVYTFMYIGEGFVRGFFHGRVAEFSLGSDNPQLLRKLSDYDAVLWVEFKTSLGVTGWTDHGAYPSFDGQSESAGATPYIAVVGHQQQGDYWDYELEVYSAGQPARLRIGDEERSCCTAAAPEKVHTGFVLSSDETALVELLSQNSTERLAVAFVQPGITTADDNDGSQLHYIADRVLLGHTERVYFAAWRPDGRMLASASYDGTIKLWDWSSGEALRTLAGHSDMVFFVAFSPDGNYVASASRDGTAKIWRVESGEEVRTLSGHTHWVHSVAFSPDGNLVATGSDDHSVKVWDPQTGNELYTLNGHDGSVMSVAFSPDGRYLASAGMDDVIRLWNLEKRATVDGGVVHAGPVTGIAFSPDGRYLASASHDGTAKIWDLPRHALAATLRAKSEVNSVAFTPDGKHLAGACFDGTVRIWNVATSNEELVLSGHASRVFGVDFSPDGSMLASTGEDKTVRLWRRL